jgi:Histidine kinase-, DNA gyrase B-, and HSP90-like ATPase
MSAAKSKESESGKLRIGDDWNAIRIIAFSQSNPLKAIAEFVENSIDAHAKTIAITRGREHGEHYLTVKDDGDGVPRDPNGLPDFKYVATHICDSIKRRLKADSAGGGLQGEFGIGLLSFWTVGQTLMMTSSGADQRAYQMVMSKGDPRYTVNPRRVLFAEQGTELKIGPLLDGIRSLSGEKIQWYLAAELRDRIRATQVRVTVVDKLARKQYQVEPRQFEGRLLHQLPAVRSPFGEAYAELYLTEPAENCRVALTRGGTRVIEDIGTLPGLDRAPWSSRYLQGLIDVSYLNLTPGTRSGIVHDERYGAFARLSHRSKRASTASSTHSAAPRKSRRGGSPCVPSSAPFARPCWSCRARNMTGLISSHGHRKQPVPAIRRSDAWRPPVRRMGTWRAFRNRAEANPHSASSSTMQGLCTRS